MREADISSRRGGDDKRVESFPIRGGIVLLAAVAAIFLVAIGILARAAATGNQALFNSMAWLIPSMGVVSLVLALGGSIVVRQMMKGQDNGAEQQDPAQAELSETQEVEETTQGAVEPNVTQPAQRYAQELGVARLPKDERKDRDPILLWNAVALEADRVSHTNGKNEQTGPTRSSRALAIVHLAMYDAYAGFVDDNNIMPPYIGGIPFPPNASPDAAVAAAAHKTLSKLYPSQKPFFDLVLAGAGDEADPGDDFGEAVAQQILDDRAGDPSAGGDYTPLLQRGKHRPDPDNPGQGFHAPIYGAKSKGFAITQRHELAPPPFDNDEYRKALREVRGKGIAPELMGTLPDDIEARTVDETVVGIFWGYDGAFGLGTPPRLYNQIIRRVAKAKGNSVAMNARLFAFVNVAMADAGILAWDQKYIHNFWRPVVGIREHDNSMGPAATQADNDVSDNCDSSWLPLGAPLTNRIGKNFTPPFPAYPSGHATFGAAAFHVTRLFYGVNAGDRKSDDLFDNLDFVSEELNDVNTDNRGAVRPRHLRNFPGGLWKMIEENGRSRVNLGIHWIFDAFAVKNNGDPDLARKVGNKFIGGVPLGLQIAEDIFQAGGGKAPKRSPVGPRT